MHKKKGSKSAVPEGKLAAQKVSSKIVVMHGDGENDVIDAVYKTNDDTLEPGEKKRKFNGQDDDDDEEGKKTKMNDDTPKIRRVATGLKTMNDTQRKQKMDTMNAQREALPVYQSKEVILEAITSRYTTIIVGETGSGKTTQIPQFLNEYLHSKTFSKVRRASLSRIQQQNKTKTKNNNEIKLKPIKKIAITQPRRVAAMSIAGRVAEEQGCDFIGDKVGYTIRFNDVTTNETQIKFMTDGILLRELLLSPKLDQYSVIIIDEAHERTVRTDILFGLLKQIQREQIDMVSRGEMIPEDVVKIVVMSATLNADRFSQFFDDAPVLYISGRQFPVKLYSAAQRVEDYVDSAIVTVFQIHQLEPKGDILVFLTGQDDIDNAEKIINESARGLASHHEKLLVCPIYSSMPTQQQQLVFQPTPAGCRKVVLSTNIAETSITIPGIRYVVDAGLSKIRWFDTNKKIDALTVKPISKAAVEQRTGRAGREAPGVCYRLFTDTAFQRLADDTEPEILRCNLEGVVLLLKSLGIDDVVGFPYVDRPSRDTLIKSLETLRLLGALDSKGKMTHVGKKMTCFPIEPVFARVLLSSNGNRCTKEILTLISLLSVENIFLSPADRREESNLARQKFKSFDGDHMTLINVFNAYEGKRWAQENYINNRAMIQAIDIRKQLSQVAKQQGLDVNLSCLSDRDTASSEPMLKSLLAGFFQNIAIVQLDGSYQTLFGKQEVHIHPASTMFRKRKMPDVIMFTELIRTTKNYMRCVSTIRPDWAKEIVKAQHTTHQK